MNLPTNEWRCVILVGFLSLLSACIVVPTGSDIREIDISGFQPGVTTKYDVQRKLGAPNLLDEDEFAVYRLGENNFYMIDLHGGSTISGEIYHITFSYDARGVIREVRYDKTVGRNATDLVMLERRFPGHSVELAANDSYYTMDISTNGQWVTAVSAKRFVFHEIEGQHREIAREEFNFTSASEISDCLLNLHDIERQKQNPEYVWLLDYQHKEPFYRLCIPLGGLAISEDGNLLAVGGKTGLEFRSLESGNVYPRNLDPSPIFGVAFNAKNEYLASYKNTNQFGSRFAAELNLRSLPSLGLSRTIYRNNPITATTFSNDGDRFALATITHVELWRRSDETGQQTTSSWPYELERIFPKPPRVHFNSGNVHRYAAGYAPGRALNFSADGKILMDLDGLLHLWDTRDGTLLARIGSQVGLVNAAFHQDKEIVIVSGSHHSFAWRPPFSARFKRVKLWRLPLKTVIGH